MVNDLCIKANETATNFFIVYSYTILAQLEVSFFFLL